MTPYSLHSLPERLPDGRAVLLYVLRSRVSFRVLVLEKAFGAMGEGDRARAVRGLAERFREEYMWFVADGGFGGGAMYSRGRVDGFRGSGWGTLALDLEVSSGF